MSIAEGHQYRCQLGAGMVSRGEDVSWHVVCSLILNEVFSMVVLIATNLVTSIRLRQTFASESMS